MRPIDGDKLTRVLELFEGHLIKFRCIKAAQAVRAIIKFIKTPILEIKEDDKK